MGGLGASGRNQSDRGPPHCADSDNFESITTPESRADSATLIVVD